MPPIQTATRAVLAIRVHCPIEPDTLAALLSGDIGAIERDPHAARMREAIARHPAVGDFGPYIAVAELSPGWEIFTVTPAAKPTLGKPGKQQVSPTLIMTLHIDAATPPARLDAALAALIAAHPWETPVVELTETRLLLRG